MMPVSPYVAKPAAGLILHYDARYISVSAKCTQPKYETTTHEQLPYQNKTKYNLLFLKHVNLQNSLGSLVCILPE